MTPGAQALDLLLATNRTVNVGPPASPLPLDQQHPGLELGGGGVERAPGPSHPQLLPALEPTETQNPVYPQDLDLPRAPN